MWFYEFVIRIIWTFLDKISHFLEFYTVIPGKDPILRINIWLICQFFESFTFRQIIINWL